MSSIQLFNQDCRAGMISLPSNSIDLIITDPPYDHAGLHTFQILADESYRIMKHGASLIFITGHYYLDEIFKFFQDSRLKYYWTLILTFDKYHNIAKTRSVRSKCKPMLWFVKGEPNVYNKEQMVVDRIKLTGKLGITKPYHKWEQDISFCKYYIQNLTQKGDTILDPFSGSGTVAIACHKLKRNFIGYEIDRKSYLTSKEKIKRFTGIKI